MQHLFRTYSAPMQAACSPHAGGMLPTRRRRAARSLHTCCPLAGGVLVACCLRAAALQTACSEPAGSRVVFSGGTRRKGSGSAPGPPRACCGTVGVFRKGSVSRSCGGHDLRAGAGPEFGARARRGCIRGGPGRREFARANSAVFLGRTGCPVPSRMRFRIPSLSADPRGSGAVHRPGPPRHGPGGRSPDGCPAGPARPWVVASRPGGGGARQGEHPVEPAPREAGARAHREVLVASRLL